MAAPNSASSSSGASQLTEQALAPRLDLTEVWARIHTFGRFPKKRRGPESAAQHEEDSLYYFLYDAKKLGIPDDVWSEMRNYSASQPVESQGEKLINEVKALGHYPKESKSNLIETQLVSKIKTAMKRGAFQPAELTELEDLSKRSVHPIDLHLVRHKRCVRCVCAQCL